jgi:hypothetical protein
MSQRKSIALMAATALAASVAGCGGSSKPSSGGSSTGSSGAAAKAEAYVRQQAGVSSHCVDQGQGNFKCVTADGQHHYLVYMSPDGNSNSFSSY